MVAKGKVPAAESANRPDGFRPLEAIGLSKAARMLRGRGKDGEPAPPAVWSVRRWVLDGCRPQGPGGPVLRLRAVRYCGAWLTMPDWVEEFERERVRLGTLDPLANEPTRRNVEARKARAEKKAEEMGIGKRGQQGGGRR